MYITYTNPGTSFLYPNHTNLPHTSPFVSFPNIDMIMNVIEFLESELVELLK